MNENTLIHLLGQAGIGFEVVYHGEAGLCPFEDLAVAA